MHALYGFANHAPALEFWFWTGLVLTLAGAAFWFAFVNFHRARLIENIPTAKLRSAPQGYVELEGKARALSNSVLQAPLSGRPCVWFSYEIEKYVGGRNNKWRTVEKGTSDALFLLEDDTGRCLVNPKGARVTPGYHAVWTGRRRHPAPNSAPAASNTWRGLHFQVYWTGGYRYTERRLDAGDEVYAIGLFKSVSDASRLPGHAREVSAILGRLKRDRQTLLTRFDTDGDGQIDLGEWEAARQFAVDQVKARHRVPDRHGVIDTLGRTGDQRRPFLLSAAPQHELIGLYKLFSHGSLAGFFVAGAVAAWMIGQRLV